MKSGIPRPLKSFDKSGRQSTVFSVEAATDAILFFGETERVCPYDSTIWA